MLRLKERDYVRTSKARNVELMRDDPERLLDVSEAAALLHVKNKTLYAWVSRNKIPYRMICSLVRFHRRELMEWAKGQQQNTSKATSEQILFADFVGETYLPWSKIHKASYDDDVRTTSVLTNFFKGKNLREIKPAMIEQYKAKRIGAGRAQATVNRELSILSKVFTLAVRHEKADVNPCQGVERFALDNERVRYLTEDEEQRLFQAMGITSN